MSTNIERLIERLNIILDVEGGEPSVSPASKPSDKAPVLSGGLYIHDNMNVEKLTNDELLLTHTLLHKFYASGHKKLTKRNIEKLHEDVKLKINHTDFDKLDRI